jgi:hypothetical protein
VQPREGCRRPELIGALKGRNFGKRLVRRKCRGSGALRGTALAAHRVHPTAKRKEHAMASKQQDKGKQLGDVPGNQTPNTPNIDESAREHGSRSHAQGEHKGGSQSAQKSEPRTQGKSEHKGQASGESRGQGGGAGQHERRRHDKG